MKNNATNKNLVRNKTGQRAKNLTIEVQTNLIAPSKNHKFTLKSSRFGDLGFIIEALYLEKNDRKPRKNNSHTKPRSHEGKYIGKCVFFVFAVYPGVGVASCETRFLIGGHAHGLCLSLKAAFQMRPCCVSNRIWLVFVVHATFDLLSKGGMHMPFERTTCMELNQPRILKKWFIYENTTAHFRRSCKGVRSVAPGISRKHLLPAIN